MEHDLTLYYASSSLRLEIDAARDEDHEDYIGAPPPELVQLVVRTRAAAGTMARSARKVADRDCAYERSRRGCADLLRDAWRARHDLDDVLDGWGPYL